MKYTVALSDVVKQMAVPEMSVVGRAGCRLYYKFQVCILRLKIKQLEKFYIYSYLLITRY